MIGRLEPVNVTEPKPGVVIFDLGRNFAGWATLRASAPSGTKLTLRYGELLLPDRTLNPMTSVAGQIKGKRRNATGQEESVGGPGAPPIAWQSDTYIAKGQGTESYTPRFTFHAFRYVELTGLPGKAAREMVTGLRLSADVQRAGSFSSSEAQFNRIQEICDETFLSNLFSVQSDCPHRERFGYGGDLAATSEAFMMNYDMANFYAKAVRDLADSAGAERAVHRHLAFRGHPVLRHRLGHGASVGADAIARVLRQAGAGGGAVCRREALARPGGRAQSRVHCGGRGSAITRRSRRDRAGRW